MTTSHLLKLENLIFLNINQLKVLFSDIQLNSVYKKIQRWIKAGKIIKLRNGLYLTKEYFEKNQSFNNFRIFIANNLLYPSYVSGAYILQNYEILTDITYTITSVTLKSSRKYNNEIGDFIYNSMSDELYTGYVQETYLDQTVYLASKAKALFDFLYFKYYGNKLLPENILERERFDLSGFTEKEKKEFQKYCDLSRGTLFQNAANLLFNE